MSTRLQSEDLTRYQLLDMATILTLIAPTLADSMDVDVTGHNMVAERSQAEGNLEELRKQLHWLRTCNQSASDEEIHRRVARAVESALAILAEVD